ncbi:MAG: EamA family transporter [Actinomycetota bacterium]
MRRGTPTLWVALAIVYTVWGSTYLAIRVAIETLPPMLMASVRFLIAGGLLYAIAIRGGDRADDRPGWRQWRAAAIVGTLLFLGGNGGVVWAEQRVSSGVAALIVASVPLWMALIAFGALKERLPRVAVAGLIVGFIGTAILINPSGSESIDTLGALAVVGASIAWAIGTLYAGRAPLPSRGFVSAAMQMICGGVALGVVAVAGGELGKIHPENFSRSSLLALAYLIVFGAIVAFSAYSYIVQNARPAIVSTYAYVNPVIAVMLGWAFLDEHVGPTTLLAGAIIVIAVAMIVSSKVRGEGEPAAGAPPLEENLATESA